jgi:putative OPT family oligopeptide transporter
LSNAYGIGAPTEKHPTPLAAPQARLMADVSKGVFSGDLPWTFVYIGVGVSCIVAGIDLVMLLFNSPFRIPVLGFATGLYLPFDLSMPLLLGGFLSLVAKKHINLYCRRVTNSNRQSDTITTELEQKKVAWEQVGMLFSAGLITGESIIGILMAIPIVISGNTRVFAVSQHDLNLWWLSLILLTIIFVLFYIIRIGYLVPLRR